MIRVVGLGSGAPEAVPAIALAALAEAPRVLAPPLDPALAAVLPGQPAALDLAAVPDDAVIAAPDAQAHLIARALPGAETVPGREALRARAIGAEVAALAEVGLRLRRECPWDREQTAETIVPHTIEEAFEVADAVVSGGEGLADELGDLLFQSVFLAQLLEEEGGADLAAVARGQADKLIRRHPHVYGDASAATASGVVDIWERRKREERADQGMFHDLPAGLPALALATKAQKRAASAGFDHPDAGVGAGQARRGGRRAARRSRRPGARRRPLRRRRRGPRPGRRPRAGPEGVLPALPRPGRGSRPPRRRGGPGLRGPPARRAAALVRGRPRRRGRPPVGRVTLDHPGSPASAVEPSRSTASAGRRLAEGFIPASARPGPRARPEGTSMRRMNETPKVVISNTLTESPWENAVVAGGDLAETVNGPKAQPAGT